MSEATDYIKSFDKLLKEKPILEADLASLRAQIEEAKRSLEELTSSKSKLLSDIKKAEEKSISKIRLERDQVDKTLNEERVRLAVLSEELTGREQIVSGRESNAKSAENENDDKEIKLLAFGKKLKHLEIDLKARDEEQQAREDRIDSKTIKLNSMIDHNNALASSAESALKDVKNAEVNVRTSQEEALKEQERLNKFKKELQAWEKKLQKDQKDLDGQAEDIRIKAAENETNMAIISKKQKDTNDKERALSAMQVDLDFKLAKIKRANK